jgi:hypothetical protein
MSDNVEWNNGKEWLIAILGGLSIAAFVVILFALVFILFPAPARADTPVMVTMFNPEVRIVLTNQQSDKPGYYKCVAQRIDKQYLRGIWTLTKHKMVRIEWDGGDFTELPEKNFHKDVIPETVSQPKNEIKGDSI